VAFEAWRKTTEAEPETAPFPADPELALRDEPDPDPLIEEMTERLRAGLGSLIAVDEWGRTLAWRNVVRLAVGPLSGRLRDAETAAVIATSLAPEEPEPAAEVAAEVAAEPEPEPEPVAEVAEVAGPEAEVAEPEAEVAEPEAEVAEPETELPTVEVILPHAQEQGPVAYEAPPAVKPFNASLFGTRTTSVVLVSADERPVSVSTLDAGELAGGGGADDTTSAKYDRFLTSLYGEGQQVGRDEDSRAGGARLSDDLQGGVHS
jgi:hypothetical protein